MTPCPVCGTHVRAVDPRGCPHCGAAPSPTTTRAALLLGLALTACGPLGGQPKYGLGETDFADADSDGYDSVEDCDDQDATVHPEAKETAGDGVDSNCNGDDDT